jgi:c-di-GMP-binding flagellar brake protein YcgR
MVNNNALETAMDPEIPMEAELTLFRTQLRDLQRRRDRRYRCGLATSGKLQFAVTGETLSAWVTNLSQAGVGMEMSQALEVGQEFILVVRSADNTTLRLPGHVIHATPVANGTWRVGGKFSDKLSPEVMETLL